MTKADMDSEPMRDMLERVCLEVVEKADLGKTMPTTRRFERNTMIELKRFEVFLRLYVSDEIRCSVRINTAEHKARRDNFALYSPPDGTSEAEARRVIEQEIALGRTLEAMAAASYSPKGDPKWVGEHLGPWLEKWCDPGQRALPGRQEPTRIGVALSADDLRTLRELAFCKRVSPNKAAARILSEYLGGWRAEGAEAEALERVRRRSEALSKGEPS